MGNKSGKIPTEDLKILKHKTNFTDEEIHEWHRVFKVSLHNSLLKHQSKNYETRGKYKLL